MSRKINLAAVEARPSLIEGPQLVNIAKSLGNTIYFQATTIPDMRFGERLFDSEGEIEVSDEELQLIKGAVPSLLAWAQDAVLKIIGD